MIFRLIRLVLFPSLILFAGYYIIQKHNIPQTSSPLTLNHSLNSSSAVKYVKKFKGGFLTLTAQKSKLISPDHILLNGMAAVFEKDGKTVTIRGDVCNLKMDEKKAYIKDKVVIETLNTTCDTSTAVIDFLNDSLYGNSEVEGKRSGTNFVASGFSLNENGIINLTRAIIKG